MSFARQSAWSLATLLFWLSVSVVLARVLGAEARGAYDLAVRLSGLVLAVSQWGIPEVLLQALGDDRDSRDGPSRKPALVGTALGVGLAATLLAGGVVALAAPPLAGSLLKGVDATLVLVAVGGSLLVLVGSFARRFIQLDGRIGAYNALDFGRNVLFLSLAVGLALAVRPAELGALAAWVIAELALALAAGVYLWRRVAGGWRFEPALARVFLLSGLPVQVGLLANFLGNEGGRYVVNGSLDLAAVGVYGVALSVARLVTQVSMALRTVLQPRLTGSVANSAEVTERVTRHGVLWMLLLAAGLAAGSPLMGAIFGPDFAGSGPLLIAFLPGMLAYGVAQLLAGHLLRVGQRCVLAASSWVFAFASVGLQVAGIRLYGVYGAALGLSVAYALMAAIVVWAFSRAARRPLAGVLPRRGDLALYATLLRRPAQRPV